MYDKLGITQRQMAELSGHSVTTINRELAARKIEPLPSSSVRNKKTSAHDCRSVLYDLYAHKNPILKKIHVFYNFKGGVGKTSLCYQVSSHLALLGYKVLVIDSDPQANLSSAYGLSQNMDLATLSDVLIKGVPIEAAKVQIFSGLDLIASNLSMTRLEADLDKLPRREEQLLECLNASKPYYDFILIDANPSINLINRNSITAADVLNIVCETQPFSLNGLSLVLEDLKDYFSKIKIDFPKINIIPNKYEDRMTTSAEAMTVLRDHYGQFLKPDFAVRKSEDFNNSVKNGIPLAFFAKKNSIAWEDVLEVVHHIVDISVEASKAEKVA